MFHAPANIFMYVSIDSAENYCANGNVWIMHKNPNHFLKKPFENDKEKRFSIQNQNA